VTGEYRYDIALSFAAEQRDYVQQVATRCESSGIRVFYDEFEQANLWGKNLYEHLSSVYSTAARYCLIFVSADYARKAWTTLERRSVQERAFEQHDEYLLPVIFDDTRVPGIWRTLGYIDARTTRPAQLVEIIQNKLNTATDPGRLSGRTHRPRKALRRTDASGLRRVIRRRRGQMGVAAFLVAALAIGIALTLPRWHPATRLSPAGASHPPTAPTADGRTSVPSATATTSPVAVSAVDSALATFGAMEGSCPRSVALPDRPSGLTITAPTLGSRLTGQTTVSGWARADHPGEHLWTFLYAPAACLYYILKPLFGELTTGPWTYQIDINGNQPGRFEIYAAIVDTVVDHKLRSLQDFFDHQPPGSDTSRVYRIPSTARYTHTTVVCCI
jgi:TIR domain